MGNGKSGVRKREKPAFSFDGLSQSEQMNKIAELQFAMGQTGFEAGDPNTNPDNKLYVNTGKSMNINAYLLSDGENINSSDSNWNGLINKAWIKNAIKKIDAGMAPLSESIQTTRFISGGALGKMLGLNVDNNNVGKFIETIQNNPEAKQAFTNVLKGTSYTHKAYTSTTYLSEHGTYDTKDIRLNITLKKGTPAIVTNNHAEHEILAGRNAKYDFSKAKWKIIKTKKGKSQLVIDVTI